MELELKITQAREDQNCRTTKFEMAKDASGPIFMSTQTNTHFIITAHLKGFGKEDMRIKINEEGTEIVIGLEKAVRELVMSGWVFQKKALEMKGLIKAFRIPSGVVLDRIKAVFDEPDSVLTILMPKSATGIVKEDHIAEADDGNAGDPLQRSIVKHDDDDDQEEIYNNNNSNNNDNVFEGGDDNNECKEEEEEDKNINSKKKAEDKKINNIKMCKPCCVIAGSSILVTLVVIAIHWIRSKKRSQLE